MMRALWSAASGMIAQQTNVDTISNNIANVNTTGYKTEKTEFKSLLYQNLQARTTTANGENKPIPAQVGLGTRVASNTSMFTQGAMLASESDTAFAIHGEAFFAVLVPAGVERIPLMRRVCHVSPSARGCAPFKFPLARFSYDESVVIHPAFRIVRALRTKQYWRNQK